MRSSVDRQARFQLAQLGGAMGDPSRAAMLVALMGGRSLPAGELARVAGVSPSTAAGHLGHLCAVGLLDVRPSGRHRLYRLADAAVAAQLERLAVLGVKPGRRGSRVPDGLVEARLCHSHLAGRLSVALWSRARRAGWVTWEDERCVLLPRGRHVLSAAGLDLPGPSALHGQACLDWSERVPHVSGPLGIAVARVVLEAGWFKRRDADRGLRVTVRGRTALSALGVD